MFSDANLPEPEIIWEIENPPRLAEIDGSDGVFFNPTFTDDRRIRAYTYGLLKQARKLLPEGYCFMVFEGYRSLSAQKKLWEQVVSEQKELHPDLDIRSDEFIALCDRYCANPYRQGSGHQSGAAIDITLCDSQGNLYDMGGTVRGFGPEAEFDYPVSEMARKNRDILKQALCSVGFVNYPSEWWHYSFGDRLWARLTGSKIAIFGRLEND